MAEHDYQYEFVNGPGMFDLAYSLFKGKGVNFTAKKQFGDLSTECWKLVIRSCHIGNDDLCADEIYNIAGTISASGPTFHSLNHNIGCCLFSGRYDAKRRKGTVGVTVYTE